MADKLQEHLVNIETALGGTGDLPSEDVDKLDWHLTKIEDLIEEGGGGGGTKLYKHLVTVSGINLVGEEGGCQLCIISASSQQITDVFDGNYISVKIWDSTFEECRGYIVYLDGTDLNVFGGSVDPETGDLMFIPIPEYCLSEVTIESDEVTAL